MSGAATDGQGEEGSGGLSRGVELTDELAWINECFPLPGRGEHMHVSVYLLSGGGRRTVVDSGSFYHRERILRRLDEATDGAGLDAIVLSHSDYPHSGNISAFRRDWGDIEIVASSGAPDIQGLPYARKAPLGEEMEVQGRRLSFVDPPLADRSHTSWIYDHRTKALFTADGFGDYHPPGQCASTSRERPHRVAEEEIRAYHADALRWLRYVDPPKLMDRLRSILAERDVRWIAPVHGSPIAGEDAGAYLDKLERAVARIAADHPVPRA